MASPKPAKDDAPKTEPSDAPPDTQAPAPIPMDATTLSLSIDTPGKTVSLIIEQSLLDTIPGADFGPDDVLPDERNFQATLCDRLDIDFNPDVFAKHNTPKKLLDYLLRRIGRSLEGYVDHVLPVAMPEARMVNEALGYFKGRSLKTYETLRDAIRGKTVSAADLATALQFAKGTDPQKGGILERQINAIAELKKAEKEAGAPK